MSLFSSSAMSGIYGGTFILFILTINRLLLIWMGPLCVWSLCSVVVNAMLSVVAVSSMRSSTVWTGRALCYIFTSQWNHVDRQSMSTCVLQPCRGRPVCINCYPLYCLRCSC